jgi:hypothetical protein
MSHPMFKLETLHWPYGITVEPVADGLLLRPKKKARAGWARKFAGKTTIDGTEALRALENDFDAKEWEW